MEVLGQVLAGAVWRRWVSALLRANRIEVASTRATILRSRDQHLAW